MDSWRCGDARIDQKHRERETERERERNGEREREREGERERPRSFNPVCLCLAYCGGLRGPGFGTIAMGSLV